MSKRKVHYREPWSFVDLKYDGMYEKERLKGNLKKIYQNKQGIDSKEKLKN